MTQLNKKLICSHEELLMLDSKKSYTAIANEIIFHIVSNRKIAAAVRLWLFIRAKQSRFKDREFLQITVSSLSDQLGVGKTTIQNWQKVLEKHGYLEIIRTKKDKNDNFPNKYRSCLPKNIYTLIQGNKDRTKKKDGQLPCINPVNPNLDDKNKLKQEGDLMVHDPKPNPDTERGLSEHTQKPKLKSYKTNPSINPDKRDVNSNLETKPKIKIETLSEDQKSKLIIKLKNIEHIPQWVLIAIPGLSFFLENNVLKISKANVFICKYLEQHKKEILNFVEDILSISLNKLELVNELKPVPPKTPRKTHNIVQIFTDNPRQVNEDYVMERLLKSSTSKTKKLTNIEKISLTKEIIYSIYEGSLNHLPPHHGLNIALKLVKDLRWRTPKGYPQKGPNK